MTQRRIFVSADWSQLETWLTAHFSGDKQMRADLNEQLAGGPKIHAVNAQRIYGCAPEDAKDVKINLQGRRKPAYDGGKRAGHAFNYGMRAKHMAQVFWIPVSEASRILAIMNNTYPGVVRWREQLCDDVFGVWRYACLRCGYAQEGAGRCPRCSRGRRAVPLRYDGVAQAPKRVLYTPFGRRRIYLGRRKDGANAVAAQLPQSCGISMWYRTLMRLHGEDFYEEGEERGGWPVPRGATLWSPRLHAYGQLYAPAETFVATGTYDSFLEETPERGHEDVLSWLLWTMEQEWPELDGSRFPAEGSVGFNWRKHDDSCANCGHGQHRRVTCRERGCPCCCWVPANSGGLVDVERKAFSSECPSEYVR